MSKDAKTIALVVAGTLATLGLAIVVGGWLMVGHTSHLMPYRQAIGPSRPDPTVFATVVGKAKSGVDLTRLLTMSPPMAARGKELFGTYCAACHGVSGKGDGPAASALKPPPRDLASPQGWTGGYTLAEIYITLTEGVAGTGMGAFGTLPPADRFALAQYVESLGHFDHHDQPATEIAALDARYHLSAGVAAPNKVAVPTVMKHAAAEYQAPPPIDLPAAARTDRGAVLVRRLVVDPVRAAAVLSQVPDWRTDLTDFARAAVAGTPRNGFHPAVATLDRTDWQAFHDALVTQTPPPPRGGSPGAAQAPAAGTAPSPVAPAAGAVQTPATPAAGARPAPGASGAASAVKGSAPCPTAAKDLVAQGKAIFAGNGNCIACHGPDARGTPLAPDLTDKAWLDIDGSVPAIVKLITEGVAHPKQHPAPMPPMGGAQLSNAQVCALAAYVYSLAHGLQGSE